MKKNKIFWWAIAIVWFLMLFELIQMFFTKELTKIGIYISKKLFD